MSYFKGGLDYAVFNDTLTFTSQSPTVQCVDIAIIPDDIAEPAEDFIITASPTSNNVILRPEEISVTIFDNDSMFCLQDICAIMLCIVLFSLALLLFLENERMRFTEGEERADICVILEGRLAMDLEINLATQAGTATGKGDQFLIVILDYYT